MEPQKLSDLVTLARQGDSSAREELITFHRSFIHQVASRWSGKPLDWKNDDELSIALLAFNEALDRYEARRGAGFLTYASTVMRNRLIDYFRKESRITYVPDLPEQEDFDVGPAELREAWTRYEEEQEEIHTAEEIDHFIAELVKYGVTLADLVASSPKHRDTKATLLKSVRILLDRPDLMATMKRTRQLPLKELQLASGVSRKVLENGRRYIVAVAVVMDNPDLQRIRNHIQLPELKEVAPVHGQA